MLSSLRVVLRLLAVVLVGGAVYLVVLQPKANVASLDLGKTVTVSVQCSSVMDQWRHHAQPAALELDGIHLTNLEAADSDCASASRTIKRVGVALVVGAGVALVVSFVFRRRR